VVVVILHRCIILMQMDVIKNVEEQLVHQRMWTLQPVANGQYEYVKLVENGIIHPQLLLPVQNLPQL